MSLAVVYSRAQTGINSPLVTVEAQITNGLPQLSIVGLPETSVKESRDRVRGALISANFKFPNRRIIINLAPADLPKEGGRFDLAIALGILAASGQIPKQNLAEYEFIGELSLTGALRSIHGALPAALQSTAQKRTLVVPHDNAAEASLVKKARILGAHSLLEVCAELNGEHPITPFVADTTPTIYASLDKDIADIRGQRHAKRALEIAAAGGHSLIMIGPPGTGKTMLASRLSTILPTMSETEALETACLYSISTQGFAWESWGQRPYRAPHHTASAVALVGGGSNPKPGEISLAHNGVLFLDELPEFDRRVLEVLREPIESGHIVISRAARQAEFPARFQLVTAMNPCPCGYFGDSSGRCRCTEDQIKRYRNRISGPLLDRIDIHIEVPRITKEIINQQQRTPCENSADIRTRTEAAREIQLARCNKANFQLNTRDIEKYCQLGPKDNQLIEQAIEKLGLSARAYHRILKIARTIADLAAMTDINNAHLSEAISYRRLDRHNL